MQRLRRIVLAAAVLAAIGLPKVPVSARQQQTTFRGGVTLVRVDVTVVDRDGRPVTGLSADDFEITLNGKVRKVSTLSYVEATEPTRSEVPGRRADETGGGRLVATNAVPAEDQRISILAVDDLSFQPDEGRRLLSAARTFVEGRPANELIGVTTTSGAIAVNPTHDRAAIVAALGRVVGSFIDPRRPAGNEAPLIGIGEALEIGAHNNTSVLDAAITRECLDGGRATQTGEYGAASNAIGIYNSKCASDVATSARLISSLVQGQARQQVSALARVLDAMKEAPGLKQMIVLTQGVAATRDLATLFEPIVLAAAAAGVQVAILTEDSDDVDLSSQERGSTGLGQVVGSSLADRRREDRRMFVAGLDSLAGLTGGTFERVISSNEAAFSRAAMASASVYHLGVDAPPDARPAQSFVVGAAVNREGAIVRVNRRTIVASDAAPKTPEARVLNAIRYGTPYYAVPVRVGIARRRAAGGEIELALDVEVPAAVAGPVKVTIGVLDEHNALKQGTRTLSRPEGGAPYRYAITMPVAMGAHRVRVAVEDTAGRLGSVDADVEARLNAMGPLQASDLLTWRKDGSGRPELLALEEIPPGLSTLNAGIELYTVAGSVVPGHLAVRLSILRAGGTSAIAEVDLIPKIDGDVRRAEAALPLANLAPGSYVLRATVEGDGRRLGQVSANLSIPPR